MGGGGPRAGARYWRGQSQGHFWHRASYSGMLYKVLNILSGFQSLTLCPSFSVLLISFNTLETGILRVSAGPASDSSPAPPLAGRPRPQT